MATKKKTESGAAARGAALAKRATAVGQEKGVISEEAEPVPAGVLKKLRLPNDEKISPALKEVLAVDASWLGLSFDEDEPEFDAMSLEDLVEQEFDEEAVSLFGEAYDVLSEECILLGGEGQSRDFLYVGTPDDAGEYPVVTVHLGDAPWVGGFVPFDVWAAVRLGALAAGDGRAAAPPGYEAAAQALAQENGDGRVVFEPKAGDASERGDDEDEEEEEEEDDALAAPPADASGSCPAGVAAPSLPPPRRPARFAPGSPPARAAVAPASSVNRARARAAVALASPTSSVNRAPARTAGASTSPVEIVAYHGPGGRGPQAGALAAAGARPPA